MFLNGGSAWNDGGCCRQKSAYAGSVHYEYNDELLLTTYRSFSEVLNPDPGHGIMKEVLPGY